MAAVIRESVIYSRMRATRKVDQTLAPSRKMSTHAAAIDGPSSTILSKIPTSPSIRHHGPIRVRLPSTSVSSSNTHAEHWTEVEDLRSVSDSTSSGDFLRSKKCKVEQYNDPWKDFRPKWHTSSEIDEAEGDKECGHLSNSNETINSCREPPLCLRSKMRGSLQGDEKGHCHPRPKSNERCLNWLRGKCDKSYNCKYIHEDLEYDDHGFVRLFSFLYVFFVQTSIQNDSSGNKMAVVVLRRGPETMMRTLHRHIRVTFGPGFCVAELSTGFESFSIIIQGLLDIPDSEILDLVKPFGKVKELRRSIDRTSEITLKVYFEKTSEAFAALIGLHGIKSLGNTLNVKPGNETNGNRLVFKGNTVRFEWDAPHRTVYMGYSNRRLAEQAIDDTLSKRYGDFIPIANIHIGIPAVGAVTVRFRFLPVDVDQDEMKAFGPHEGMVTGKANVKCSSQDMIRGFKYMLKSKCSTFTDVDIRGPPYTNGKMIAWVTFANARDAEDAAAKFHLSPNFMDGMSISAFHVKSISVSLTLFKYQMVETEILAFQDKVSRENDGYWVKVSVRKEFVNIQLSGGEIKVLGSLKAELERTLNGEQLYENGKVVWHPFLAGPDGRELLDKLEEEYLGITIIVSPARSSIRLLGDPGKRALVRERIINHIKARRARTQYILPLDPDVAKTFAHDGFAALETSLGQENILLDLRQNRLVVFDLDTYNLAKDALFAFRRKHGLIGPQWRAEICPACTSVASIPMKLPCGHSWCRSCLQHYLKSATERESLFPLTCHGIQKKCGEPIPLSTARELLPLDDFESLFHSAFSAHVVAHANKLHYCPTPDCPQIYRSTPQGIFMQCPECLSQICTHCHSEAHEDLTCADVHDGDGLFWEWASGNDIKRCPKCKMAIEKMEGCNHMTCRMCQTHICWVCMQVFENGLKIYGHMQAEHGGSGI